MKQKLVSSFMYIYFSKNRTQKYNYSLILLKIIVMKQKLVSSFIYINVYIIKKIMIMYYENYN